jgi:hypothetical protein
MKWLFKWLFRLAVLSLVLIVALVLSKDAITKAVAEQRIRARTGMDVKIGRCSVGILSPVVTIENLKLYNRPEFGGTPFLDIRELHVEYDRAALRHRKLHVTLMRFSLTELTVVKNEAGQTNLVSLMTEPVARHTGSRIRDRARDLEFAGIDVLNLSLGKVRFLDLKDPRQNSALDLGVKNQVFRNVNSEGDMFGVLLMIWLRSGGGNQPVGETIPSRVTSPVGSTNQARSAKASWALPTPPVKK